MTTVEKFKQLKELQECGDSLAIDGLLFMAGDFDWCGGNALTDAEDEGLVDQDGLLTVRGRDMLPMAREYFGVENAS